MKVLNTGSKSLVLLLGATLVSARASGQVPLAVPERVTAVPATGAPIRAATMDTTFRQQQLASPRVLVALLDTKFKLKDLFRQRGLPYPAAAMYVRVFKRDHEMEVWVKPIENARYVLLKTYSVCTISGHLGPKLLQGDEQTPEGFYYIDDFNPRSGYFLSLHINYPNEADRLRSPAAAELGSEIFIHGGCKTVGCLP